MKTTWAKAEYMRGGDFKARYHELYLSIQAPYAEELTTAGPWRRFFLNYLIMREYRQAMGTAVEIEDRPKRSNSEIIVGLMCSSGMMLLVCAVPTGIVFGLQGYSKFDLGFNGAITFWAAMTLLTAGTGGILLRLGLYLARRHKRVVSN
jgi:hypothetical protein